jgi:hypothetical protein
MGFRHRKLGVGGENCFVGFRDDEDDDESLEFVGEFRASTPTSGPLP